MKRWKFLLICTGYVCLSAFAFSGCGDSAKTQAPAEEAKPEESGEQAEEAKPEESGEQAEEEKKAESVELVDGMYIYSNEEFKFSMAFPGDWDAPKGEVDEDGDLNVDVASKDEMEYVFVTIGEVDPAAPTPEEFEKQLISEMETEFDKVKQESETISINGVEFIKSKMEMESEEVIQVTYIAYAGEMYYAITIIEVAEKWESAQPTIEKIEKSIKIQQ